MRFFSASLLLLTVSISAACDLCAIYSADDALGAKGRGFSVAVSEQWIPYRTVQLESEEIDVNDPSYVDTSITHLVLAYSFSPAFSLNFNLPLEYNNFRRTDLEYVIGSPPVL